MRNIYFLMHDQDPTSSTNYLGFICDSAISFFKCLLSVPLLANGNKKQVNFNL